MEPAPGANECERALRQTSLKDTQSTDCDDCLVLSIYRMEVRHAVFAVIHVDDDPIELSETRQP